MKIKIYFLLLLFLLLLGCSKKQKITIKNDYYSKGIEFILNYSKIFEKNNNLCLASYGINLDATINTPPRNSIHQFDVTFYAIEKLDINNARKKIIKCSKEYLNEINNNEELRNYLYKYPFTNKELFLCISFYEINGKRLTDDYITSCAMEEDIIYYIVKYSDGSFERIHEEPYEEALRIVNNDIIPNIPKKKSQRIYIPKFDEAEEIYPGISKITPK